MARRPPPRHSCGNYCKPDQGRYRLSRVNYICRRITSNQMLPKFAPIEPLGGPGHETRDSSPPSSQRLAATRRWPQLRIQSSSVRLLLIPVVVRPMVITFGRPELPIGRKVPLRNPCYVNRSCGGRSLQGFKKLECFFIACAATGRLNVPPRLANPRSPIPMLDVQPILKP